MKISTGGDAGPSLADYATPEARRQLLTHDAAFAAAPKQHHQRNARSKPDCPLNGRFH